MSVVRNFENFYLKETEQYSYYVLPQILIKDKIFESLSDSAKIVYSILLTRSSLSTRNGWIDEEGKVYIIFSRKELAEEINKSERYVTTLTNELANFGLIKKRRRGQGNTDVIYVMNFNKPLADYNASDFDEKEENDRNAHSLLSEVNNTSPLEVNNTSPLEVNNTSLLKVNNDSPLEVNNTSLLKVNNDSPLEVNNTSLPNDSKRKNRLINNINQSNQCIGYTGDDDTSVKNRIGYAHAVSVFGEGIAGAVYANLCIRGSIRSLTISQGEFFEICRGIAEYNRKINNLEAFVDSCVNNMLKAKEQALRKKKGKEAKSGNSFNHFEQNAYDFGELERQLLDN